VEDLFQQAPFRYLRRQLPRDDILDAMVNSVTAVRAYPDYLTVPQQSEKEAKGLPMGMVYTF
jgi:predicted RNase H-like nuclease